MPRKTTIKKDSFANKDEKNKSNRRQSNEIETYVVEAILEKKKMNGIWKYKVKWMDYSEDECTWEPAGNLVGVQDMLNDFNERLKEDNIEEEKSNKEKESRKIDSTMKEKANKVKEKNSRKKEKKSDSKKERESISPAPKKKVKPNEEYNEYESDKKILGVSSYGHFELGDIPRRIIHSKKEKNSIIFTIEWMPRKNGKTPVNTEMTNLEIRKYDKNLLLDFYESHLKFIKPCASKDIAKVSANKDNYQSIDLEEEEEKQKERDNEEQINEFREKQRQEISVDGDELQKNTNDNIRANDPIQIEDDTSQKNSKNDQDNQEDLDYQAEDVSEGKLSEGRLSEGRHIADEDKREENKPEEAQEGIQNNEETIQKITFDSENMIDNGGQPIFADLGFNVADEIRDLALDEHLRVVSQNNPDITKPIENKENSLQNMERSEKNEDQEHSEKNGDQEQSEKNEDPEQSEKNEDQEQSEKNEDQELQLESPKEISDSSSQVDPFLI